MVGGYAGSASYARWKLTVLLTCAQIMVFFHRSLVTLFAEPIKLEYGVSDTLIGVLIGPAFSFSFVLAALPLGIIADRSDRFRLLGISIAIWSLLTSLIAAATGFVWLIACRIGIAAAMSGVTPSAGSVIADLYPRQNMAKPFGFYASGIHMGTGLAMLVGAGLAYYIDPFTAWPVGPFGRLSGWKIIFLIAGLPGLLLAGLFIFLRDPYRTADTAPPGRREPSAVDHFFGHARLYIALILSLSLLVFVSSAIGAWLPTLFLRKHGWTPEEIGLWHGTIVVTAGILGAGGSGYLVAALGRLTRIDPQLSLLLLTAVLALPIATAMPLVSSPYVCLILYFLRSLMGGIIFAVGLGLVLGYSAPPHRAQMAALVGIAFNAIGGGVGPVSVAVTTDFIFGEPQALPQSIAIVSGIASTLAVALLATLRFGRERS